MNSAASIATAIWSGKPQAERTLATIVGVAFVMQILPAASEWVQAFLGNPSFRSAFGQSLLAGSATALGAMALAILHRPSVRGLGVAMAVAAGAMSTASIATLLLPAWHHGAASPLTIALAAGTGAALMWLIDRALPHQHPCPNANRAPPATSHRAAWLLVVAITLHNVPEGLAVGVAGTDSTATAVAIGLQNIPEGLIIAAVLWAIGLRRSVAIAVAAGSGLAEPLGALLGIGWIGSIPAAAPAAMALAAGAMLFVVAHELLPAATRTLSVWRAGCYFAGGFATIGVAGQLT